MPWFLVNQIFVTSIPKFQCHMYLSFVFQLKTGCLREVSVLYLVSSGTPFCSRCMFCSMLSAFIARTVAFAASTASYVISCFVASLCHFVLFASHSLKDLAIYILIFTFDTMHHYLPYRITPVVA